MRVAAVVVVAGLAGVVACGVESNPGVIGVWRNGTHQVLNVRPDLTGWLTQSATCSPTLEVSLERDPFGGWAIRFEPNQRIFYPPIQKRFFLGESFCSSPGSMPMCNFCQVEETRMTCDATRQEIVGSGVRVSHDCSWLSVPTTTTSSVPPAACGRRARDPTCAER